MKRGWYLVVVIGLVTTVVQANNSNSVRITADTPWVVAANEPEPVQRALADVQRDWYKVFGHRPIVLTEAPQTWTGPLIHFGLTGKTDAPESFALHVEGNTLAATGADMRGEIYAAYTFAEEILGVDPWYFWTDHEPAARSQIEVPGDLNKQFGPPTFRYRGWFINDEDLLGGFAPDPLRENVFSLEMIDRICETILRLRGNMIVPGTFNFPDERCWELAARRGLALNMHHILVVGLNTYRWPKDVPFSYTKHPDIMERYWRDCIAAYKGREVVWTVGYRGKHDHPFWRDEPELNTPEARGAVITKAIAKQVELIHAADPNAMIIANLWSEGADLMQAGHLKLPVSVVQVWPDDGTGMIRDNGAVQAGQGVYFHTAMLSGSQNQLSEMVPPSRIYSELGRFARAGATNFFLVNTSDVRPVPLSTDCAMRFVWNASSQHDQNEFLLDWSCRQFGAKLAHDIAAIYSRYFDIPYQRQETRHGDNRLHTMLRTLDRAFAPQLADSKPFSKSSLANARDVRQFAVTNLAYVTELAAEAELLTQKVPGERRGFFQSHVLTPIQIHQYSLEMLENYSAALIGRDVRKVEQALRSVEKLFDALHRAETGKWPAWYLGERFVGLEASRDRIRVLLAALRGEPPPPVRPSIGYPELYQYQERFSTNFPRLYAPTQLKVNTQNAAQ